MIALIPPFSFLQGSTLPTPWWHWVVAFAAVITVNVAVVVIVMAITGGKG